MVLARVLCGLLVGVLMAGCAHPASPVPAPAVTASATTASMSVAGVAVPRSVDVSWSGQLPYGAWACDPRLGCQTVPTTAYGVSHAVDGLQGALVSGNLTLTWTSASPLTQQLSLGAIVQVPGCDSCNRTHLGPDISGPSPLVFTVPAGLVLAPGAQLQMWVYSAQYEATGSDAVGTSAQQDFAVAGDLVLAS